ncbi:energy transducer TonB [Polynucleobacter necessarius]|uniref:energy transducer TonB n=1 Tax=Polynucleobacter necessarius TaxID=576610 RepID=UPI000E095843|nr:energy transducer TonB [Polynucleobacter necessarius]
MVNLAWERVGASSHQQFSAKPQTSSVSNGKYISSSTSNDSKSLGDSRGVGHEAKGDARSVIYNPKPLYPLASRRLWEQGLVIVRMCVNEHGLVQAVEVFKSSGFEGLDRSALNTLVQWRFAPIAENSISLSAQCFQTLIQFSLEV